MILAHYALQKLHIRPAELAAMTMEEKAFIYASIEVYAEENKRASERRGW